MTTFQNNVERLKELTTATEIIANSDCICALVKAEIIAKICDLISEVVDDIAISH